MTRYWWIIQTVLIASPVFAGEPVEVWNKAFDSGNFDQGTDVAVKGSGIVVVGSSRNESDYDFRIIEYSGDGEIQWDTTYDSGNDDQAYGVAVNGAGNIYVTGHHYNGDDYDCLTLCYDSDRNLKWEKIWDTGDNEQPFGVVVGSSGEVLITGAAHDAGSNDILTVKYDAQGNKAWDELYGENLNEQGGAVGADPAGNVYVTGVVFDNQFHTDCVTLKYDPSGDLQWDVSYDDGDGDGGAGIVVDDDAEMVYVTGTTSPMMNPDVLLLCYDSDGNEMWNNTYNFTVLDVATDIAMDASHLYVTGNTTPGTSQQILTFRCDKDGNLEWTKTFSSDGGNDAYGIAVSGPYVYVTGTVNYGDDTDIRTIKYEQDDVGVAEQPIAKQKLSVHIKHNLTSSPVIRCTIPQGSTGSLAIYTTDGRLVRKFTLSEPESSISVNESMPRGVYFVELETTAGKVSARLVSLR